MLDLKFVRENIEQVKFAIDAKHANADMDAFINLDETRRKIIAEVEQLKATRNQASKEIGKMRKVGGDPTSILKEMEQVSEKLKELDAQLKEVEDQTQQILLEIPNMPHESIPHGGESQNKEIRIVGEKPIFNFQPKPHWDLAEDLGIIDLKASARMTGSGFILFKKEGALLERALINFMLDVHVTEHGFTEVFPPFLVNRNSMIGTGQLPKMEDDMYCIEKEDLFLIPTAEVPVTNIHREETLNEAELPIKYVAYTPCFRREAGSYGKDTRGINRVHQFDKVEMVKLVHPEKSYEHLEKLVEFAEKILQKLGLHYRVLMLADGDISFAASKCYDLEVWSPGQDKYLEVSSCSNFEDFQARRANIRFRKSDGKTAFVHTLNGSGIALARTVIAVIENFQTEEGYIVVPEVLRSYMRGLELIKKY